MSFLVCVSCVCHITAITLFWQCRIAAPSNHRFGRATKHKNSKPPVRKHTKKNIFFTWCTTQTLTTDDGVSIYSTKTLQSFYVYMWHFANNTENDILRVYGSYTWMLSSCLFILFFYCLQCVYCTMYIYPFGSICVYIVRAFYELFPTLTNGFMRATRAQL